MIGPSFQLPRRALLIFAATLTGGAALGSVPASASPAERTLLFSEEFDGPAGSLPNQSHWVAETGGNGWGNSELETYTSRVSNAALDGRGHLAITARREVHTGFDGITRGYTSARLHNSQPFQYGYLEARIFLPAGRGLWPAFWTVGADSLKGVAWPACGEIDVMEAVNGMPKVVGTIHGPSTSGTGSYQISGSKMPAASLAGAWHTYAIDWTSSSITWFLDGVAYFTSRKADLPAGDRWEFDKPHIMRLNLAVGGLWPGSPDAATIFPATMLVDYIRRYSN